MKDEESVNLKRRIVEKGVKQLLDEAKVPLQLHLKVVQELKKATDKNAKQAEEHAAKTKEHADTVAQLHEYYQQELKGLGQKVDEVHTNHTSQVEEYRAEIERLKTLKKGEDGLPGLDAEPVDEEALISKVLSKVPPPEKGAKGDPGETPSLDRLVEAVIARVQKGDVLHINHVKGAAGFIKDGIRYRYEELMHGSGSSTGTLSGTQEKSTTVPNGIQTSFAFAHVPKVIVWNGAVQTKTDDYTVSGNSITFTASAGVPLTGDKIINIYG